MTEEGLFEQLTAREHEILSLIVAGLSNQEIAGRLVIARSTVKWYIRQIYNKLGVDKRREAIARARESGLVADSLALPQRPHHNLVAQTTPFIGRQDDLDALAALLADPQIRLITILGPGGMGKTRLALETAARHVEHFADGVYFIPLQALSEPEHILPAIAEQTGFEFQPDERPPRQQLLDFLRHKSLLLLPDNFEHLLGGVGLLGEI